ncbi:hypothetical protein MJO28_009590 [Puccinia striiformis f. sp. tritici]|uniref:Uncharacterized protein n=1 Tax=Puccinia striiformis f. sp. tritici TaxID=168172 RepID=A0ACC0E846_9BASI|nr:hypothetical protein MJO28_009590 [Puccinia striiformis f. sp. tritici]
MWGSASRVTEGGIRGFGGRAEPWSPGISIGVYPTTAEEVHPAQTEDKLEQLLQSLLEVGICELTHARLHQLASSLDKLNS